MSAADRPEVRAAVAALGLVAAGPAAAHAIGPGADPLAIWISQGLFLLAWSGYTMGAICRRPATERRAAFHLGMLVAGIALFGPFDRWADSSSAMHMTQHMLLMVVVAPLLVLARPQPQWRAVLGRALDPWLRWLARAAARPGACALLHALAIWGWHAPAAYEAALHDNRLHVLEHASFLATAWLFWGSVLRAPRRSSLDAAMALLFTLMHTGLLGALLVFAPAPLYFSESRELWDQQLAGLAMWVPGGLAYLGAAGWMGWRWLEDRGRPDPVVPAAWADRAAE